MAVKRKPADKGVSQDSKEFQEYLGKGADNTGSQPKPPQNDVRFSLTIPGYLNQELEDIRSALPVKTSRHRWVLEAVHEKVQRDKKKRKPLA